MCLCFSCHKTPSETAEELPAALIHLGSHAVTVSGAEFVPSNVPLGSRLGPDVLRLNPGLFMGQILPSFGGIQPQFLFIISMEKKNSGLRWRWYKSAGGTSSFSLLLSYLEIKILQTCTYLRSNGADLAPAASHIRLVVSGAWKDTGTNEPAVFWNVSFGVKGWGHTLHVCPPGLLFVLYIYVNLAWTESIVLYYCCPK